MRRRLALAACLALVGCSGASPRPAPPAPAPVASPAQAPDALPIQALPAPEIGSPSFELTVHEVIASAFQDTAVILRIYAAGVLLGETTPAPRSQPKRWSAAIPDGNHLLRVEICDAVVTDGTFTFKPWPPERQPRERFIRVLPGELTSVMIKFFDAGRQNELAVERRPR